MADFLQGFLGTYQSGVEARNDVTVAIRNWFANRNPLVTRLPYVPVERVDFLMYTHKYRARSTTLGAAVTSNFADRDHDRRRDVLDEPRRASVRRFGDREHASTCRSAATRPASTTFNVLRGIGRHDAACERRQRLDRELDRQQPQRRRGQPDRSARRSASRVRSIARRSSSRCRSAARPRPPGRRSCRAAFRRRSIST